MNAKTLIQVGIALIFLGIVAFTYPGGDTGVEPAVRIWPVQAGVDAMKSLADSPMKIGLVLVGGIVLVAFGVRKPT